jgi:hypothetical protein
MYRLLFSLLVPLVLPALPLQAAEAPGVTISAAPERPIVEQRGDGHLLNFDMILRNKGNATYRIAKIELSVYDDKGVLAARKALNTDAFAPSIMVIGEQILAPGKGLDIFNPFSQFEGRMPLARLRYDFCLLREDTPAQREANRHRLPDDCDFVSSLAVTPRVYAGKTPLMLPVRGKVFIWEGHDFYAHHLRVPLGNPKMAAMGIAANSNEFANDFIYTDAEGNAYSGDPRTLANWHSYGKPLYAPGAGIVREAVGDIPDNQFANAAATSIVYPHLPPGKDPQDLGNHVLIDHGNGEFSLLLHMKPGSVTVKAGDPVAQGQEIGAIGFTGDAIFPHLHYVLMDGPQTGKSWGLPAYFSHFRRYFGTASQEKGLDSINSGDFVESDARP